jgi:uncharacterized protein
MKLSGLAVTLMAVLAAACSPKADAQSSPQTAPQAQAAQAEGAPYVLKGTQVWTVPDPVSGRDYEVFVSLPASYEANPQRRYPVLYVTDADYAFPIIRQVARRVNLDGPRLEEFILVGLSYSRGDSGVVSRNRDYTPTPNGPRSASSNVHGQGAAYQTYLKNEVLPFIDNRFRADPARRVLLGHSYGGLLGTQILFTDPSMFQAYVLGSPSFWFDKSHIMTMEAAYARSHTDLPADVFMYVGDWEVPGPNPRNTNGANLVRDMQTMETTLKSHHYPNLRVQSLVLTDEDHLTVAPVGFTRGLLAVLPAK